MALTGLEKELETLDRAMSRGIRKVKYTDKEITYGTYDEMLKARNLILKRLGRGKKCKKIQMRFNKGVS